MKQLHVQYNIGLVPYVVNYHDGIKAHRDGSAFYDIRTFRNKKKMNMFLRELVRAGYVENKGVNNYAF